MSRPSFFLNAILCALWLTGSGGVTFAQTFGGSPPWGTETPTRFRGEIRTGHEFEHPIGAGLSLRVKIAGEGGTIEVGPSGSSEDYSDCETGPPHGHTPKELVAWDFQGHPEGPGGIGNKRSIYFALTSVDNDAECESSRRAYQGQGTFEESRASGLCLFQPLSVNLSHAEPDEQVIEALTFEAECGLYGGLELWLLPARYLIPPTFAGWVSVYSGQPGRPELPRSGTHIVVSVGNSAVIRTSSVLRYDSRGEIFETTKHIPIATTGPNRMIWGEARGYGSCGSFSSFFVGTETLYHKSGPSPAVEDQGPSACPAKR